MILNNLEENPIKKSENSNFISPYCKNSHKTILRKVCNYTIINTITLQTLPQTLMSTNSMST
jgi:hypothetical protein